MKKIQILFIFVFCFSLLTFTFNCYAKEITIIYTGQTHAMIYPCNCPIQPDGGIARRATLINQIRKDNPNCLVLDSGDFFAGGTLDEYIQNTQLDTQRTNINLKAMELMKYDAAAIGDDELNFGTEFLKEKIAKTKLAFLSCNLKLDKVQPYAIKQVSGIKIGITAITSPLAKQKGQGLEFSDPKQALSNALAEMKKGGANIIVLLSHMGENDSLSLVNNVEGIDILILSHTDQKEEAYKKIGNTLILKPSWEGREFRKVNLSIEENKVTDYKVEELRLSSQVSDDPAILSMLPACFSDYNCKKEGFTGACENPADMKSACEFIKVNQIRLLVINTNDCVVCNTSQFSDYLKKQFPGLTVSYLSYPDKKAQELIEEFSVPGLPAYFLGKEIREDRNFDAFKENLELKGDYYMVKPQFCGFAYYINRKKINGNLDLFISLYDKNTPELLDVIKEFNPRIHFLAAEEQGKFNALKGNIESEDYLRAVCVKKYYPDKFWDYISCRAKNIDTSWWEDCAASMNVSKIKTCARGLEGNQLLKDNTALNKELGVMFGPTYLSNNQEIFASKGVPKKEELKNIIKR